MARDWQIRIPYFLKATIATVTDALRKPDHPQRSKRSKRLAAHDVLVALKQFTPLRHADINVFKCLDSNIKKVEKEKAQIQDA